MIIETSKCEYMQIILTETIQLSIGVQTWTEKYISVCALHTGLIIFRHYFEDRKLGGKQRSKAHYL